MNALRTSFRRRGFTAAELSAVAAIIAILALIVIPIFRDRVDEARRVGTLDDMQGLAKALLLANADVSFYPRLNDLDNGPQYTPTAVRPEIEVPLGDNNSRFTDARRVGLQTQWKGPYAAFQNHLTLGQLEFLRDDYLSVNFGPIRIFGTLPLGNGSNLNDSTIDRYPTDHYGSPYIFFAPGTYVATIGSPTGNESSFSNGVIYSLGPDASIGVGLGPSGNPDPLTNPGRRENGSLGTGDDLTYIF